MPCSVPSHGLAFLRLDSVKKETERLPEHSNLDDEELFVVIDYCPVVVCNMPLIPTIAPWGHKPVGRYLS